MKNPEKFPLSWPQGYPVTKQREYSKFMCTMAEARDGVMYQLSRFNATDVIISTNVQVDKRGMIPASGRLVYDNPGVAVYFKLISGELKVVACDKWMYLHENMRAIEKTIEALRGIDRWGATDIISRATEGMKALAENAGSSNGAWWVILEVEQNATKAEIKAAHRALSTKYHPDNLVTGNKDKFIQVQTAFQEATI